MYPRRAAVFLAAYAWPILEPSLSRPVKRTCDVVVYVIWGLFAIDFVALIRVLNRRAVTSLQGRVAIYVGASALLIVFVASVAMLETERGKPHSTINSFGDALW